MIPQISEETEASSASCSVSTIGSSSRPVSPTPSMSSSSSDGSIKQESDRRTKIRNLIQDISAGIADLSNLIDKLKEQDKKQFEQLLQSFEDDAPPPPSVINKKPKKKKPKRKPPAKKSEPPKPHLVADKPVSPSLSSLPNTDSTVITRDDSKIIESEKEGTENNPPEEKLNADTLFQKVYANLKTIVKEETSGEITLIPKHNYKADKMNALSDSEQAYIISLIEGRLPEINNATFQNILMLIEKIAARNEFKDTVSKEAYNSFISRLRRFKILNIYFKIKNNKLYEMNISSAPQLFPLPHTVIQFKPITQSTDRTPEQSRYDQLLVPRKENRVSVNMHSTHQPAPSSLVSPALLSDPTTPQIQPSYIRQ